MGRIGYDASEYYKRKALLPKPDGKHCIICGKELPKYSRKYCSTECFDNWYRNISGILDWGTLRSNYLKANPKCAICGDARPYVEVEIYSKWLERVEVKTKTNLTVDHIVPICMGGKEFDWNNLQTLCHKHHDEKSRKENSKIISIKLKRVHRKNMSSSYYWRWQKDYGRDPWDKVMIKDFFKMVESQPVLYTRLEKFSSDESKLGDDHLHKPPP